MSKTLKLTCLIISCFLSEFTFGQDNEKPSGQGVEFGLQHSINFTHLNGEGGPIIYSNRVENYDQLRSRLAFDLGMFATIHLSEKFALQTEAMYSYMGGHFQKRTTYLHDLGAFEGTENESFAMDYIKAIVAGNIKFNERVFFQVGGYGASLLSSEIFYPWWEVDIDKSRTHLTGIRSIDAGVIGGFGLSTKVLNITFRYNYGLLDVFESGDLEELNLQNGVLQFVFQWKLHSDFR